MPRSVALREVKVALDTKKWCTKLRKERNYKDTEDTKKKFSQSYPKGSQSYMKSYHILYLFE